MGKYIIYSLSFCLLVIGGLILRPVPMVKESKAIVVTGKVDAIHGTKNQDIFIYLKDVPKRFYINRGEEEGLSVKDLSEKLEGEVVTLKYPKYWTPLDWNNRIKHISKLEFKNEVLFNELKKG